MKTFKEFINEAKRVNIDDIIKQYVSLHGKEINIENFKKNLPAHYKDMADKYSKDIMLKAIEANKPTDSFPWIEAELYAKVIEIGPVNISSGNTKYKWSIYEPGNYLYINKTPSILFGAKNSFGKHTLIACEPNDSPYNYSFNFKINYELESSAKNLIKYLGILGYDAAPLKPFQKAGRNHKSVIKSAFSIKGVGDMSEIFEKS